ncbi:MAG: GGDEF domain-containing protein [Myxococcales bacterium]|nr:GGDEF domain-containing protein [Myxococcales bacterium]MCB9628478.1 GGDEF domain-containing protein [Sandaracinaceae bacterium]
MASGAPRAWLHALLALSCVTLVGYLDHRTGNEIRLFPLYFLPIGWAAWYASTAVTGVVIASSTVAWVTAAYTSGMHYSEAYIWPVNALAQTVAFGSIGAMAIGLKRRLVHEIRSSREDVLTTVLNKRGFQEQTREFLSRLDGDAAVFVFVDLDNFKQVNDEHGHDAGDVALIEAARLLRASTRHHDAVGRWGGDEFVLLLRETDLPTAERVLERLRVALETEMGKRGWPITASIGALEVRAPAPSIDEVVKAADRLMYRAKEKGKNCVVTAQFEELTPG